MQALEVTCVPQKIQLTPAEREHRDSRFITTKMIIVLAAIFALFVILHMAFEEKSERRPFYAIPLAIINIAAIVSFRLYYNPDSGLAEQKKRARFTRFFTTFSRIQTLVLDGLSCKGILEATITTLGDCQVENLEIRENRYDQRLQYV